jgi:hypothetical protein
VRSNTPVGFAVTLCATFQPRSIPHRDRWISPASQCSRRPGWRAASRRAVRIDGIGVGVALVAVPRAIAIAVDADPLAGAGRDGGEGHGPEPGEQAPRPVAGRRRGAARRSVRNRPLPTWSKPARTRPSRRAARRRRPRAARRRRTIESRRNQGVADPWLCPPHVAGTHDRTRQDPGDRSPGPDVALDSETSRWFVKSQIVACRERNHSAAARSSRAAVEWIDCTR